MDNSTPSQNRKSRRSQVLLSATLEHGGTSQSVKLRNLSSEGALVEADKLPIEGTSVVFCRNELCTQGHVVWVNGHYAGVAFSEKLAPEQVLRHVPTPRPRIQPKPYRPGLTPRNMTPEQRRLAAAGRDRQAHEGVRVRQPPHRVAVGGVQHHTGHLRQRPLHAPHARGAGHPLNGENRFC